MDRLTRPLAWFLRIETFSGGLLLLSAVIALWLANSPWAQTYSHAWETPLGIHIGAFEFTRSTREWINDGLMTLFFFLVALELKRELVLGELRNPRQAAFSIAAALGGMLAPAAVYLALRFGREGVHGWGTVMATDTAFVIGCLALLGRRIPQSLRVFMLSLAIVDDIGAILVVAIGYSSQLSWGALAIGVAAMICVRGMGLVGIRSIPLYVAIGVLSWIAIDASGIHATITGVVLGLLTPTGRWVSHGRLQAILDRAVTTPSGDRATDMAERRKAWRLAEVATRETLSPVERLEITLHPWVSFVVMPLFALANAGIPISVGELVSPLTLAIFVGFILGKPAGILIFGWLAVRFGMATRPEHLGWGMLAGGSLLAGIGFTMALFIADLAFPDELINTAKLGVMASSVVAAVAGLTVLSCSTRGTRKGDPGSDTEARE